MGFMNKIGKGALSLAVTGTGLLASGTYKAAKFAGQKVYDNREEIWGGVKGAATGVENIGKEVYGLTLTEADFAAKTEKLEEQSKEFAELCQKQKEMYTDKEICLDSLGIAADYLGQYGFIDPIPDDINTAYELQYPDEAAVMSLEERVNTLDEDSITGFISGLKGKLFEMRYVDYLNSDGNLPDGFTAELAHSATNPGWDIAIFDGDGHIDDVLQAKATESVPYIMEALDKYPDIDVVTTDEVYSRVAMHELSANVINSGISDHDLTQAVTEGIRGDSLHFHYGPPIAALFIIAYSVYKKDYLNSVEKSTEFGRRYVKSYLSALAGSAVAVVTHTWILGLFGAIGTRYILGRGASKLTRWNSLVKLVDTNEEILQRMRRFALLGEIVTMVGLIM